MTIGRAGSTRWATSLNALKIMRAFVVSTEQDHYGYNLGTITDSSPQSLYSVLRKMHFNGWLDFHIEETTSKRPKKFYTMNEVGLAAAIDALSPLQVPKLMFASAST